MRIWQPIKEYEGLYEVSNDGLVKSFHKDKSGVIMKQTIQKNSHTNYMSVMLVCKYKTRKTIMVHRLVAEAFVSNPHSKLHVNHLDNNGENNNSYNLEWCTQQENMVHSSKQGRHIGAITKANKVQSKQALDKRKEMIGKKYGKWIVLKDMPKEYTTKTISKMLCRCECGTEKEVDMISLKIGRSTQCMKCATSKPRRRR